MANSIFMRVEEVAEVLDVSVAYAYKLNKELEKQGCITISGRIDRNYFMEQFYKPNNKKEED